MSPYTYLLRMAKIADSMAEQIVDVLKKAAKDPDLDPEDYAGLCYAADNTFFRPFGMRLPNQ